jgi:hypothetical protein
MEKFEFTSWTVGKIEASQNKDLDNRVNDLIEVRRNIDIAIQAELDVIYYIVEQRIKNKRYVKI